MATLSAEQDARRALLAQVKDRWEATLLAIPGVTGTGVGFKWVRGKPTEDLAIRVYVKNKRRVTQTERIPHRLDGYPTDVIELDPKPIPSVLELPTEEEVQRLTEDHERYDPLVGGISVGPCRQVGGGYIAGTLGVVVKDSGGGGNMLLSNAHVFCGDDGGANVGDEMGQPARGDSWKPWCQDVADLSRFAVGDYVDPNGYNWGGVDAAVAGGLRNRNNPTPGTIKDIGKLNGFTGAALRMEVQKRGRTTELTTGDVEDVDATIQNNWGPQFGIVTLHKQILVRGRNGVRFSDAGDSGSLVVNVTVAKKLAVGLLWGGSVADPLISIISPMAAVLGAMQIRIE